MKYMKFALAVSMSDEQTRETTDILDRQNLAFVKGKFGKIFLGVFP